jgi:hypothetical protein
MNAPAETLISPEDKIAECWCAGVGISQTRLAVLRCCGVDVSFEQVRARFVELAGERV